MTSTPVMPSQSAIDDALREAEELLSKIVPVDGAMRFDTEVPMKYGFFKTLYTVVSSLKLPPSQRPPVPMLLHCPMCHERHIDEHEWTTKFHHTHACQHCGFVWRPAVVNTVGVEFLPGFKNEQKPVKAPF